MRRVRHPAPGWRRRERRRSAYARAAGFRFALALVLAPLTFEYVSAWESGETTSGERGAMTNWASDGSTGAVSARGQDAVEASRVTLAVTGGPVIVQWSLSYQAHVNATSQGPARGSPVYVHAVAALERDGV